MTLLMYAALHGNKGLCQDLIEKKVNINVRVCKSDYDLGDHDHNMKIIVAINTMLVC